VRHAAVAEIAMGCLQSSRPPYVPQYGTAQPGYGGGYQPGHVVQGKPVGYGQEPYGQAYAPYGAGAAGAAYAPTCQPAYGPSYGGGYLQPGPTYQGYQGGNYANNGGGGGGMSAGMAGLAGFAGGFLAAEVIDDIF